MKNLDLLQKQKAEILQKINAAVKSGDEEGFASAFTEFTDILQEAVMAEARGMVQAADNTILAGRGIRALTSEENKFYQAFIDAANSPNPKQALTGTDYVLPKTVIDSVMEDMAAAHPLLDAIAFENTLALTEILISTTSGSAIWGELTAAITSELGAAFSKLELSKKKLSAFILISKSMLDLGPVWIDRYVRALLVEANAAGLEDAVVDGDGDDKPLGMTRALTGAVDGVYPRKTAITITALDQTAFGTILNTLSQGPNSKRRAIQKIIMVVNPADYFTKVMPATTVRTTDGSFTKDVFPFPTEVFQCSGMPQGYAVFGIGNRYFAGLGTSKGGKIEYSDEYKFLEDQRAYLIKLYGDGKPLDANAFVLADISGLTPYIQKVYVTNDEDSPVAMFPAYDARLASLTLGSLTLSPTFNKSVFAYTAATTNATNTVTAVAMDGESTIEILNGETPVANGAAATWATGENTLTINVTSGAETETYTVIVTKS
jgi:HK97 family phage major capsid protein